MKKVQVLMSTYNGEKYLREQIDSILCQKNVEVHLLVRDDGSNDKTVEILKEYKVVEVIEAQNVGATNSFFELIQLSGEYDFYAFADQDDVWDSNKLEIAVEKLEEYDCPAIYSGNTQLVDKELNFIKNETLKPVLTLESAIVKNYVTGCTTVFNARLMGLLKQYKPQSIPFHDWWANLVCLSVGGISVYDYEPHMKYRQHDNNVVSGNGSFMKKWKSRFYKFKNTQYHRDKIAKEILQFYGDSIGSEEKKMLEACSLKKRLYKFDFRTGNSLDDFLFKLLALLKRF